MSIRFMGLSGDSKLSELRDVLLKLLNKDQDVFKKCMRSEIERIYNNMKGDGNLTFQPASMVPCAYMVHAVLLMALGERDYYRFIDPANEKERYLYPYGKDKGRAVVFNADAESNLKKCYNEKLNEYSLEDILTQLKEKDGDFEDFIKAFYARKIIHFNININGKDKEKTIEDYISAKVTNGEINYNDFAAEYMKCILESDFIINEKTSKLLSKETDIEQHIKDKKSLIFTGAPGTGKTYGVKDAIYRILLKENIAHWNIAACCEAADSKELKDCIDLKVCEERFKFVQFHSSYDYTDFVEGLRPAVIGYDSGKPIQSFVRMDGSFKKFCRNVEEKNLKDESNNKKNYYFVIDEINRADLSRVFGELMYCFENRGKDGRMETQYAGLPAYRYVGEKAKAYTAEEADIYKDGFYIPENVVIIGTMNDIDRSVETFDYALRRRFKWIEVEAGDSKTKGSLDKLSGDADKIKKHAKALNDVIADDEYRLGKEYQLGMAYFKDYKSSDDRNEYFDRELAPVLREYMRGRDRQDREDFLSVCRKAFDKGKYDKENGNL